MWFLKYIVCSESRIIFETESRDEVNGFTNALCDSYEANYEGSHSVFIKKGDHYFYSHATWFGASGVISRGHSPMPDQTDHFLKTYVKNHT